MLMTICLSVSQSNTNSVTIMKQKSFKVKSSIASHSPSNISETVRDTGVIGSKVPPIRNGLWQVEWSHDRWCHVTPKGQVVTPIRLDPNISKAAGDAV